MAECHSKNKQGQTCGFPAPEGEYYCRHHDPYKRLVKASPTEKTQIVLELIEQHPEHRLILPEHKSGTRADLKGVDLSAESLKLIRAQRAECPPWWDDRFQRPDLSNANLKGADLQRANFEGVDLRRANFERADLVGANFKQANLWEANLFADLLAANLEQAYLRAANLERAMLFNTNLKQADLREAKLKRSGLREANLERANLTGADLEQAYLQEANLERTFLDGANLKQAVLSKANLEEAYLSSVNLERAFLDGAKLKQADLSKATLKGAVLDGANFSEARLDFVRLHEFDLRLCRAIRHIFVAQVYLDNTYLEHTALGNVIGEESIADQMGNQKLHEQIRRKLRLTYEVQINFELRAEWYQLAQKGYANLKKNFQDLGDHAGATWAYLRERRMGKNASFFHMRDALSKRRFKEARRHATHALSDQFVQWLCDYGEGIWHVIRWMIFSLVILGPTLFWIFGEFQWVDSGKEVHFSRSVPWSYYFDTYLQLLLYTIDTFTTASFAEWKAASTFTRLASGCLAIIGIFLAGLLGFVAGNRIRRS